jgi:hypothetical protein
MPSYCVTRVLRQKGFDKALKWDLCGEKLEEVDGKLQCPVHGEDFNSQDILPDSLLS